MGKPDPDFPSGTVSFLFTDIEGSTRLGQQLGEASYRELLEAHRTILRDAVASEGGREFGTEGDALFAAFGSASGAIAAAARLQRGLETHAWPDGARIRVRAGIHTGQVEQEVAGGYFGLTLHRVARIAAAGHGGQVLLSEATREIAGAALPAGVTLRDLGQHRLKDFDEPEHLYQLVLEGLPVDFAPLRTIDATPNNLPTQLTSFVGREQAVAEARRLLDGARLLTLTGPGGTGKTRLSLRVAEDVVSDFPDGVFFVALAAITDPGLVPSAIARALGLPETATRTPLEALADHLHDRRALLVLDNFEQVIIAARTVGELLAAAPMVKVIVSSRATLRISGEQEFPVPPLELPDPKALPTLDVLSRFEAVALFAERAAAVKPDFRLSQENAAAVAEITARLDGLPLAVELAAARVKLLPPAAILSRLERRLGLLAGGARDLPARQQTLRGAIAWSYELLEPPARTLFARLSVFVGGWSLEAAEAICDADGDLGVDLLTGLETLVDQSLVRQEEHEREPRFRMLETIGEYARDQLAESGDEDRLGERHARHFLALAETAEPHLTSGDASTWLERLEVDHDNLRAALGWALERGSADVGLRLGAALWRFWQIRGYLDEARGRFERLLAMPERAEDAPARIDALIAAGSIVYWRGEFEAAGQYYGAAVALAREGGDTSRLAEALYNQSFVYSVPQVEMDRAAALLDEAIGLYAKIGDEAGEALGNFAYINIDLERGDYPSVRRRFEAAVTYLERVHDRFNIAWAHHLVGLADLRQGQLEQAQASFSLAISILRETRDVSGMVILLDDFSALAMERQQLDRAARLGGAAATFRSVSGALLGDAINAVEGRMRPDDPALDRAAIGAAWEEGRAMSLDEAVAYALETPSGESSDPASTMTVASVRGSGQDTDGPA